MSWACKNVIIMTYEIKVGDRIKFSVSGHRLVGTVLSVGDHVTVRDHMGMETPWTYRRARMKDVGPDVPTNLPEWWDKPETYRGLVM
jgi:hypothetical protein